MTSAPIRILVVEDRTSDAELMIHEIRRMGLEVEWTRVDTEADFRHALEGEVDIVLSDYHMPQFSAVRALEILRQHGGTIPFIVITGSISEEVAVEMMKQGASDYLLKDRLTRLGPSVLAALEQKRLRDERRRAIEATRALAHTQRILLLELDHRVRNNLSALLSLIDLTRRTTSEVDAFADSIAGRIRAMAGVHSLLSQSNWRSTDLGELIGAVTPGSSAKQIRWHGPTINVPHRQVTALGMLLHELMTNSVKHGALSVPAGSVSIQWSNEDPIDPNDVVLEWKESGGPPVSSPIHSGAGTELIHGLASSELRGEADLRYPPKGANHTIRMKLDESPEPAAARVAAMITHQEST